MGAIDYLYVANWSLCVDVKIILRTVPHVLGRRGLSDPLELATNGQPVDRQLKEPFSNDAGRYANGHSIARHIIQDNRISADHYPVANGYRTNDLCPNPDLDIVANNWRCMCRGLRHSLRRTYLTMTPTPANHHLSPDDASLTDPCLLVDHDCNSSMPAFTIRADCRLERNTAVEAHKDQALAYARQHWHMRIPEPSTYVVEAQRIDIHSDLLNNHYGQLDNTSLAYLPPLDGTTVTLGRSRENTYRQGR
jgi:hypothetical protein